MQSYNVSQINDMDKNIEMQKRNLWMMAHNKREDFLRELREEGLKGKEYSDSVVEFDKENMQVFYI